mmetsp:Transcript_33561/g.85412  ORF Transcript_33561/g.85412 Transcript_33561/m.85412 type:complete len:103 (+) Transcript_33561:41-349(+)
MAPDIFEIGALSSWSNEIGAHAKSTAALRLLPHLGFPYRFLARVGLAVPVSLRDAAYAFVGCNRSTFSKYLPLSHRIEDHRDCMLGLDGKSVAEASSGKPKS